MDPVCSDLLGLGFDSTRLDLTRLERATLRLSRAAANFMSLAGAEAVIDLALRACLPHSPIRSASSPWPDRSRRVVDSYPRVVESVDSWPSLSADTRHTQFTMLASRSGTRLAARHILPSAFVIHVVPTAPILPLSKPPSTTRHASRVATTFASAASRHFSAVPTTEASKVASPSPGTTASRVPTNKVYDSAPEALRAAGLKDGQTLSAHSKHHCTGGLSAAGTHESARSTLHEHVSFHWRCAVCEGLWEASGCVAFPRLSSTPCATAE